MLKLLCQQFGINITQEMIDKMVTDIQSCISDVHAMKDSQDRTEKMVKFLYDYLHDQINTPALAAKEKSDAK